MGNKPNDAAREPRLSPSIKDLAAKAKQAAVKAQGTVLKAVDKNGNGKIDAEDFGITKESMQDAAQKLKASANRIGESLNDAKTELDRRVLRPVFKEDLYPDSFSGDLLTAGQIPNLICIVGHDKKRTDSAVCVGAIGYWTSVKDAELLNLYEDSAALLGLQFLPSIAETFYYMDPYRSGVYVALDSYFAYLKKNRVNELEVIAQDLGAKSFRITFKEHQKVIVKQTANAGLKAGRMQGDGSRELSGSDYSRVEIAAETQFSGHSQPKTPTLVYFRNESDIEKLIRMRMDQSNPIKSKDFCFQCSRTSGMTEKTAAKIDLVLHQMKCSGTATLSSEVQREGRTELEYHIEF